MTRRTPLATALTAALVLAAPAIALAAHADLRPGTELAAGSPAELSITVDGNVTRQPKMPHVENATIRFSGQMARSTVINGEAHGETTFLYSIVPTRTGALDIPAISVSTANGVETTAPIHATVTDAPVSPRATATASASEATPTAEPTRASLSLELSAKSLYVGQAVPVKIRAYFLGGTAATLLGAPQISSDAFTLAELSDKPAQAQIELRGVPYLQVTWTGVLSPAKPSRGKLGVELPVEIAYRARAQRQHRTMRDIFGDDLFGGDPFADFDTMFDSGPVQQHQLTLRATAGTVVVSEVPTSGAPAGFTGAVGNFSIAMDPVSGEPRVGEPLTLTAHVTGSGNFDRVALAGVPEAQGLKSYPIKSSFSPSATSKLTGDKTFTQTIIPTRDGEVTLPAISFAYFDPEKRAYTTVSTTPQSLRVAAARGGGATDPGLAASVRDPAMAPNRVDSGRIHSTLTPRYRDATFWLAPGGIALITLALVAMAWWRRSPRVRGMLGARRIDRSVSRALGAMERAQRDRDRAAFFTAARTALQTRLGAAWSIVPEAVTAADIEEHLGDRGEAIRSVFEHADAVTYANNLPTSESLDHWRSVVRAELATLETVR